MPVPPILCVVSDPGAGHPRDLARSPADQRSARCANRPQPGACKSSRRLYELLARALQRSSRMPTGPGSWMLAQLDFATRTHHLHADAGRLALLAGTVTRERYEDYMTRLFAFEGPVEARWQRTEGLDSVVDLKSSLRAGFLFTDLTTLGMRPLEPAMTPAFVGVEQALGWMYVVERGRRMNALLCRHLSRRLPQVMQIAGNYLNASSPCGTRWQQFGAALDKFAGNHVIVDQILNAAHRAFRSLRQQPRYSGSPAHAA